MLLRGVSSPGDVRACPARVLRRPRPGVPQPVVRVLRWRSCGLPSRRGPGGDGRVPGHLAVITTWIQRGRAAAHAVLGCWRAEPVVLAGGQAAEPRGHHRVVRHRRPDRPPGGHPQAGPAAPEMGSSPGQGRRRCRAGTARRARPGPARLSADPTVRVVELPRRVRQDPVIVVRRLLREALPHPQSGSGSGTRSHNPSDGP